MRHPWDYSRDDEILDMKYMMTLEGLYEIKTLFHVTFQSRPGGGMRFVFVVLGRTPRKVSRFFLFAIFDSDLESLICDDCSHDVSAGTHGTCSNQCVF